jgi:hypothetical protein
MEVLATGHVDIFFLPTIHRPELSNLIQSNLNGCGNKCVSNTENETGGTDVPKEIVIDHCK